MHLLQTDAVHALCHVTVPVHTTCSNVSFQHAFLSMYALLSARTAQLAESPVIQTVTSSELKSSREHGSYVGGRYLHTCNPAVSAAVCRQQDAANGGIATRSTSTTAVKHMVMQTEAVLEQTLTVWESIRKLVLGAHRPLMFRQQSCSLTQCLSKL